MGLKNLVGKIHTSEPEKPIVQDPVYEFVELPFTKENFDILQKQNFEMAKLILEGKEFGKRLNNIVGKDGLAGLKEGTLAFKIPSLLAKFNKEPDFAEKISDYITKVNAYEIS